MDGRVIKSKAGQLSHDECNLICVDTVDVRARKQRDRKQMLFLSNGLCISNKESLEQQFQSNLLIKDRD